jgi:molybdopterin/thiamine biosynthesis adenylyltransferase
VQRVVSANGSEERLIAREIIVAPDAAYHERTEISAVLRADYVLELSNHARANGYSLVFVHTHPFSAGVPVFSQADYDGETHLVRYFDARSPTIVLASLVVGPEGCRARLMKNQSELRVVEVDSDLRIFFDPLDGAVATEIYDRQIRAFGVAGQSILGRLTVGIVGLGGTGSVLVQQLAHPGVRRFILVDGDQVESTNLNRLVGSQEADIGRPKVEIAVDQIRSIRSDAEVTVVVGDITVAKNARLLLPADLVFLCTDTHASRAIVGQMAYQYLMPCIDMGVSISIREGKIAYITGRVQMLSAGLPCLVCTGALDSETIRRELLSESERASDPYITGIHEPQPAVISLNSTVSSLATTMFLGAVTPIPAGARFQHYDGIRGTVRIMAKEPDVNCVVCSATGAYLRGDDWPLPARQ